jgi:hypothetical protein
VQENEKVSEREQQRERAFSTIKESNRGQKSREINGVQGVLRGQGGPCVLAVGTGNLNLNLSKHLNHNFST